MNIFKNKPLISSLFYFTISLLLIFINKERISYITPLYFAIPLLTIALYFTIKADLAKRSLIIKKQTKNIKFNKIRLYQSSNDKNSTVIKIKKLPNNPTKDQFYFILTATNQSKYKFTIPNNKTSFNKMKLILDNFERKDVVSLFVIETLKTIKPNNNTVKVVEHSITFESFKGTLAN